ncbi:MATE family efflux transporter [Neptuniibacter marinus]|uniref:MATE family efflux transporter n=1 Tax=Neptuniibacter marinus TaxID=1806670 RepID=UPI0022B240FC|nr:MATE family efflux transporter [Neptuniibacter marinus]
MLNLGFPIAIAQIAQTSMGFVDTLMAGRFSSTDLAAVSLGSSIWLPIFIACQGILMATTPMVAHFVGEEKPHQANETLHQGSLIVILLSLCSMFFLHNCAPILAFMDVEPHLAILTMEYLAAISWGIPALLLYQLIRSYIEGFGKTQPAMKIAVFGLLCNIPLNYLLIYGELGFPQLGGVGCGWASAIVMWLMLFVSIIYLTNANTFRKLSPLNGWKLPEIDAFKRYVALGLPIGFALLIEVSMFSVIALLIADLGEIIIASHQITITFTGLVFMIPLSISFALTIRVGHQLGAQNAAGAIHSAKAGLIITLSIALISSGLIAFFAQQIASLYTADVEIIKIATTLLTIAAVFQLSDAIQITCSGALRGYKDTQFPLILVFISCWLVGLPTGYILGKTDLIAAQMGPSGFWIGLLIGLTISAILLLSRLTWKSKQTLHASLSI